jgi:rhamnosyltransferase
MCLNAINDSFDYICLLDQDSIFDSKDITKMKNYIENSKFFDVGIYFPEIRFDHKKYKFSTQLNLEKSSEVDWGITSGSFVNLEIFKETEGFDINYFIDRLDYDYCMYILKLNYRLLKINDAYLYQKLGKLNSLYFIKYHQHNAIRHYYIFRNRLYYYFKKDTLKVKYIFKVFFLSISQIIRVILIENHKIDKIKMILRALKDYKDKRMGKYQILN